MLWDSYDIPKQVEVGAYCESSMPTTYDEIGSSSTFFPVLF